MTRAALAVVLLSLAAIPGMSALAHEERLAVGRVAVIEPVRRLMVLADARSGSRLRLEVNPETEVIVCGTATGLAAVPVGALVRVKYLDKAGAEPEARSVLVLGGRRPAAESGGR
ncbi:MAG: hypothetical protein HY726_09545 [Candidatus Rokubacteria bacterium]|nr:hypothetical protein [Candidatus Rokubacteria bacterium]